MSGNPKHKSRNLFIKLFDRKPSKTLEDLTNTYTIDKAYFQWSQDELLKCAKYFESYFDKLFNILPDGCDIEKRQSGTLSLKSVGEDEEINPTETYALVIRNPWFKFDEFDSNWIKQAEMILRGYPSVIIVRMSGMLLKKLFDVEVSYDRWFIIGSSTDNKNLSNDELLFARMICEAKLLYHTPCVVDSQYGEIFKSVKLTK